MSDKARVYVCSWSWQTWCTTILSITMVAAFIVGSFMFRIPGVETTIRFVSLLMIPLVLSGLLYAPREYVVDEMGITVRRWAKNLALPRENITILGLDSWRSWGFSWRVMGFGGVFGYFGLFRNGTLGTFWAWCTRIDRDLVVISMNTGRTHVLSPDDPHGFIQAYQELGR